MANMKAFHEEVRLLVRIYNQAWAQKWCETSMLLEDNDLILKVSEPMGTRHYKT
jgi:hypothetical protein